MFQRCFYEVLYNSYFNLYPLWVTPALRHSDSPLGSRWIEVVTRALVQIFPDLQSAPLSPDIYLADNSKFSSYTLKVYPLTNSKMALFPSLYLPLS